MSTYRERREARAARLEEWAAKREAKAAAAHESVHRIADGIPFGQPILVGHHSERHARRDVERIDSGMRRSVENARKAEEMAAKAANIRSAADRAIYSDDHDAIERLEEKLAGLEAERDRIKAYNASCRKGAKTETPGDLSLLDDKQRREIISTAKVAPYMLGKNGAMPAYHLSNLSGVISTTRKRLGQLRAA